MEERKWKNVVYDGTLTSYDISDDGLLRNRNIGNIKIPCIRKDGYLYYQIYIIREKGKKYLKMVNAHRLVATAFIPNPNNKPEINHIDGNKTNNSVSNLEWSTRKENMEHASNTRLIKIRSGLYAAHSKYPEKAIRLVIEKLKNCIPIKEISDSTGVGIDTVRKIWIGKQYIELSRELGLTIHHPVKNFNFEPFREYVYKLILEGKSNKEIRTLLPLDLSESKYNHQIRRTKLLCEGSTTIQMVP